jgi:hypothetical protein
LTDENLCCIGICEMENTNTSKEFSNCEIVPAFQIEKSLIMLTLLFRKASIHRSEAETIDKGRSL